jgi:hypothetical protein
MASMKTITTVQQEIGAVRHWRNRYKYIIHLIALIALIILFPYFERNIIDRTFLKMLITIVVVLGIFSVSDTVKKFAVSLILAVPFVLLSGLYLVTQDNSYEIAATVFLLLFFIFATVTILVAVLSEPFVSHDTIIGAIDVYLLLGITWGIGYQVLQMFTPAAFSLTGGISTDRIIYFSDHIAYSFSCLTTLGSNDVIPISAFAKTLVSFEAICGTLYVAVLIAWLMGVFFLHNVKKTGE